MDIFNNKEFLGFVSVIAFLILGKVIKNVKWIDNRHIPILLTFTGGLLGSLFFDDTNQVLMMAGLGSFSNNLHQIYKGLAPTKEAEDYLVDKTEKIIKPK